jgi:hypothetical protein
MYLSGLFLGELIEHEGDLAGAIPYYRGAVASYPGAHTAAVALGQALVRTGLGETGWSAARTMFGDEGRGGTAVLDPWSVYRGAQYWQEASRLRLMREMVTVGGAAPAARARIASPRAPERARVGVGPHEHQ